MTRDEIVAEVQRAFADVPRPTMFIHGTCQCEECLEREQVMQSFTLDDMPLDELNNPGWDPICFATAAAFQHLVPGLVKLALYHTTDYLPAFLFHLNNSKRIALFSRRQATALIQVLDFLTLHEQESICAGFQMGCLTSVRSELMRVAESAF